MFFPSITPGGRFTDFSSIWAEKRANEAMSKVQQAEQDFKRLQEQVEKLTLICMAMWSLIKEKTALTEQDLENRVHEIDLSDGVADGRVQTQVRECPQCGKTLSKRLQRCMYCGYQPPEQAAFAPGVIPPSPQNAGG